LERSYKIDTVIIDTGIIYALSDKKDDWHKRSVSFITEFDGKLIVPSTVIPEACYLLNTYLGQSAEKKFVSSLHNREIVIEHININDLSRCVELLDKYDNLNIGFVDASLIAVSERLRINKILTTDRRHFHSVKPNHCNAFNLLP
jgi:predicted nucleic acid-binding protein